MRALCIGVIHAYTDRPLSAKLTPLLTVLIAATKSNPNLSSIQTHALYAVVYWGVYAGIWRIPTSGFFWQRILTSVIINKQGTFRPFATPLCVYPPPFLAIHHWLYVVLSCRCRSTVSYDYPLHAYHLKCRRLRGDMIEVFKITHNIYDRTVGLSPDLTLNERANTRGNHYKLQNHTFHYDLYESIFFCAHCKYLEQLA